MLKKCFKLIRKLCYPIKTNQFRNNGSAIACLRLKVSPKPIRKLNTLTKNVGVTILTSLWYQVGPNEDVEDNLAHLITLAQIALERGDIERAQEILRLGLKLSEEHNVYSGVPYLYDILATIALNQGKTKQAEDLLVTAIEKLTIWGYPDDHYNVIDFKLRLARIYSSSGNDGFAKLGFESCLEQQKAKLLAGDTSERTSILYVNILFWYGVHLIRISEFADAKNMIDTAHQYAMIIKGLSPKQEMVILFTLADINAQLGNFDMAVSSMLDAIMLGKGIGSIELPYCYYKLGKIYEKTGATELAQFAFEEAIKSAKVFGFFDIMLDSEDALEDINKVKDKKITSTKKNKH